MAGPRILGLDPGTKRIGVSLSDELGMFAQPIETYRRRSFHEDMNYIRSLVVRHEVGKVVVGLPVHMTGRIGSDGGPVQKFLEGLERNLTVPVVTWDERLTTQAAERLLIEADVSRRKRKGAVDRVAAAILLQSYLDSLSSPQEGDDRGSSEVTCGKVESAEGEDRLPGERLGWSK